MDPVARSGRYEHPTLCARGGRATHIHESSPFASGPFVKVNCAAIPTELLESELFGHEKGAFTGAAGMRRGKLELADGGTIFLDEVGDLHPASQAKLLRVLQEGEFHRVGGEQTVRVTVRVISATNRDLAALVARQQFREDLYYRLSVVPIHVPALREHPPPFNEPATRPNGSTCCAPWTPPAGTSPPPPVPWAWSAPISTSASVRWG